VLNTILFLLMFGQEFDAATIKPTPPENSGNSQPSITLFPAGGSFRRTNATLKSLVRIAYGVQDYQISGGPGWADNDRFDVEARSGNDANRDQVLKIIQALLADRFKLKRNLRNIYPPSLVRLWSIERVSPGSMTSRLSSLPITSAAPHRYSSMARRLIRTDRRFSLPSRNNSD